MKKVSLHTFSIAMAFLVIVSTLSFTVEKHYCGKSLVGHAIFSSAEKCKSETHSCGVEGMGHMNMKKDSCCSNQTECIKGQDELNLNSVSFDLVAQSFQMPRSFSMIDLVPVFHPEVISYPPYEPPQLVYDIQVLCQVFTI